MDQQENSDLFDVKLNASSKKYLLKFAALARIVILIGIIISLIHVASTIKWYSLVDPKMYDPNSYMVIEHKWLPIYTSIYCVLFFIETYFFWKVTVFLKKGLNYNDDETFNKAFKVLFRYMVISIIAALFSLLHYGFELYGLIKTYN